MLLAFVDGELRAAVALAGGDAVADPFRRADELVALLRFRAAGGDRRTPRRRERSLVRPALGAR
jgi:hypothetical protein